MNTRGYPIYTQLDIDDLSFYPKLNGWKPINGVDIKDGDVISVCVIADGKADTVYDVKYVLNISGSTAHIIGGTILHIDEINTVSFLPTTRKIGGTSVPFFRNSNSYFIRYYLIDDSIKDD